MVRAAGHDDRRRDEYPECPDASHLCASAAGAAWMGRRPSSASVAWPSSSARRDAPGSSVTARRTCRPGRGTRAPGWDRDRGVDGCDGRSGPAARISSARSSCGSSPVGVSPGIGTTTFGVMPVPWTQRLVGRQPLGDGQPEAARFARQQVPLLDGALAVGRLAHQRGAAGVLERAREDLAGGRRPAVDQDRDRDARIDGDAVRLRGYRHLAPVGVLLPVDGAGVDELAGDGAGPRPRSRRGRRAGRARTG